MATILAFCPIVNGQEKHTVYLIAGQGTDHRVFDSLKIDTSIFRSVYIPYLIPERKETMYHYARRMSEHIDTNKSFSLIGVSLGGMLCVEMNSFLNPASVIIVASAACRNELPFRYRFQRYIPLYAFVPRWLVKSGAFIMQPLVEPDRKNNKAAFVAMLKDKDKTFLKRTVRMIIRWEKAECDYTPFHIHGDTDHTLPIKNIEADVVLENGSHMMMLTRAHEVSLLIDEHMRQARNQ